MAEWTGAHFQVQILSKDSRYWKLSIRRDSNLRCRGWACWESNALRITTRPTVLPGPSILATPKNKQHVNAAVNVIYDIIDSKKIVYEVWTNVWNDTTVVWMCFMYLWYVTSWYKSVWNNIKFKLRKIYILSNEQRIQIYAEGMKDRWVHSLQATTTPLPSPPSKASPMNKF